MRIEEINQTSPHLATVKALGRANAATLGLFPDGAFSDYAARGTILGAITPVGECVGYLLYGVARGRARIAHLCVDAAWRGQGIARLLLEALVCRTQALRGIGLSCRRDYEASRIWPRLGFVAVAERPGRGRSGKPLTLWWRDHGHPTLFTVSDMQRLQSKISVVIDANVFYDLDRGTGPPSEESRALLADWLQDDVELCITDELRNEINRNEDIANRSRLRAHADSFVTVSCSASTFDDASAALRPLFPARMTESDESDLRELARTIGAGTKFFVTRDGALLDKADDVYDAFGVSVLRPSDLIVHVDELRREAEYQPARLAGTHLELRRVAQGEQRDLAAVFQATALGETKAEFDQHIRQLLIDPQQVECDLVMGAGTSMALVAYDRARHDELRVPLIRTASVSLAPTIARHLLLRSILVSASEQRLWTRVTDPYLADTVMVAFAEDAFVQTADGWIKTNLAAAETAEQLAQRLDPLAVTASQAGDIYRRAADALRAEGAERDIHAMVDLEHLLWPAKVIDADIPTFIVPIKARWAQELFDEHLAAQTLFGARPDLALNHEAVYYRASRPAILMAPARILWYVSQDQHYYGVGSLRACSRLEEVTIGKPKDLYRQFRRLGVYEWQQVYETAGYDTNNELMAVRFSHSELLVEPIAWKLLQDILREEGCPTHIQGPVRISKNAFARLYRAGMRMNGRGEGPSGR